MKRFGLRGVFVVAALTVVLTVSANAASLGTAVIDADALRLRAKAGTDSAVISMAYKGDKVEVIEDAGNGWYKVSLKGTEGYMSSEYLKVSWNAQAPASDPVEQTDIEPEPVPTAETPASQNGKVDLSRSEVLNLRSGPSTQNSKLGTIPGGTVLALEEEADGWYKVTYNGKTGYVSAEYIVATTEEVTAVSYNSSFGERIVNLAKQFIGAPYVWGGNGPRCFDCSGFTCYLYRQMGYTIPRGGTGQFYAGTAVSKNDLQPGDLVFICDPAYAAGYPISHVGMYIGNGQFIHASSYRSEGVTISSIVSGHYANYYAGARRYV